MRVSANQFRTAVGVVALAGLALSTSALADPVTCSPNTANNHMIIDSLQVSSCLAAGVGNITGENHNDLFINNGTTGDGYESAGKSDGLNLFGITYTQTQNRSEGTTTGTFTFDASFWDDAIYGAIGFKFGTGRGSNQLDEWFVFELAQGVTTGSYIFNNLGGTGGGLSHVNLYRVPEPSGLVLLGLGVIGAGVARRRSKSV